MNEPVRLLERNFTHMVIYIFLIATGIFCHLHMHMEETIAILMLPCYSLQWLSFILRKKKNYSTFLVQKALNETCPGYHSKFISHHSLPSLIHSKHTDSSKHTPALGLLHLLFPPPELSSFPQIHVYFHILISFGFLSFLPKIPKGQMIVIF